MEKTISHEIEIFCNNVKWLRMHHKLSKNQMARIMKISVRSLNKLEQGDIPWGIGVNAILYTGIYFGVKPAKLLTERLPFD